MSEHDALVKAMRSLVNEIEDMDAFKDEKEMKQQYWFGDFSEWEELHSAGGMVGVIIEWPNLAILCEQVRKLLPPEKAVESEEEAEGCPDCKGEGKPIPFYDAEFAREGQVLAKCGNCKGWYWTEYDKDEGGSGSHVGRGY